MGIIDRARVLESKLNMKMQKDIPDDIVLVISGLFAAVVFAWGMQPCIYTELDVRIFYYSVMGMIVIPMFYSSMVYYKNKRKNK